MQLVMHKANKCAINILEAYTSIINIIIPSFILLRKTSIGQGMTILHISPSGHVTDLTVRLKSRDTTEALTILMSHPNVISLLKNQALT